MLLGIEMLQVSVFHICKKNPWCCLTCCCEHIQPVFCRPLRLPSSACCSKKSPSLCWTGLLFQELTCPHFSTNNAASSLFTLLCSTVDGGLSVPRIIINHLKWLDRIVDSKVVISAMTVGQPLRSNDRKGLFFKSLCTVTTMNHGPLHFAMAYNLQELATKLMELVSVAPVEVQRDIVTSLPEILEDSQHDDIARELKCVCWSRICTGSVW